MGSIGVFRLHVDQSRMLDDAGITSTFIVSRQSPHKVDGNPFEPLSDRARIGHQRKVDDAARWFVEAVARGRGVSPARVETSFGRGDMMLVAEARRVGMIDDVATLNTILSRSSAQARQVGGRASELPLGARPADRYRRRIALMRH